MSILAKMEIVGNVGGGRKDKDGKTQSAIQLRNVGKDNIAVANFSVASTPRVRDGNDWKDGTPLWVPCVAWGRLAENIAKSFNSGDRVFVAGYMQGKEDYEDKDGNMRKGGSELVVQFAGHECSYATTTQERNNAKSSNNSNNSDSSKPATKKAAPAAKESQSAKFQEAETSTVDDDDFDLGLDDDDEDFVF